MAKFYTPSKLSENIRETPEGFLVCLGVPIARTGEMLYGEGETPLETDEEGKVLVARDAKDIFRPQTIASFEGKAVTIKHPNEFVSPQNWKELAKGILQNVRQSGEADDDGEEMLLADLLITDALAIQLVKNGLREVSCGYEAEYEQTGKGKGRVSNIVGNHLALVEEGRAGSSYAINDHKGRVTMFEKLKEQLKKLGKTVDEAAAAEKKVVEKKVEKKAKTKDADESEKKDEKKTSDAEMYDELVQMVKDLGEKVAGLGKSKDADKDEEKESEDQDSDGDEDGDKSEDEDESSGLEERIKALEAAVSKLLESKDEESESEDEDDMSGEESEDEESDKGEKKKVGDSAKKSTGLEKTKQPKNFKVEDSGSGEGKAEPMTAEKMNELNAAHWARK